MPSYSYRCEEKFCSAIIWVQHKPDEHPPVKCPECGSLKTHRVIINSPHMKRVLTKV